MWVASTPFLSMHKLPPLVVKLHCELPWTRKRCATILVLLSNGVWSIAIAILYKPDPIISNMSAPKYACAHCLQLMSIHRYFCIVVQKGTTKLPWAKGMQSIKLPKFNVASAIISQAFLITAEEVEETGVGCYSEHMIVST
jgi:hypothetical protein